MAASEIRPTREVLPRGMHSVPADQRWFWEPEWQAGELEASEQVKTGNIAVFEDVDAIFAALNK
ncbi:MAG: hypothetical protein ACRDTH_18915 [Pseudonocardiaceae bacterium]